MNRIGAILFCIFLIAAHHTGNAQFKKIAESPEFTVPEDGFARILQLQNGNTFYIQLSVKDGMNIRIYDVAHLEKKNINLSTAYEELGKLDDIKAVFEVNNDVVVLLAHLNEKTPVLIRIIIDGSSGKLKSEKVIASIQREYRPFIASQVGFFAVRKDAFSDNYAVAVFDYAERDKTKRIELIHFSGDHKEINRKFCITPEEEKARAYLVDMVVMGNEKVIAILSIPRPDNNINVVATLEKGQPKITMTELKKIGQTTLAWGILQYNPVAKEFVLLAITSGSKQGQYASALYAIDPVTLSEKVLCMPGFSEKLNSVFNEIVNSKKGYSGMPQALIINEDGTITILSEEIMYVQKSNGSGTELGQIAVSNYSKDGRFLSDYLIPKSHWIFIKQLDPLYISEREIGALQLFHNNEYKSFSYINAAKSKYIVFNDTERNNDIRDEKMIGVAGGIDRGRIVMIQSGIIDCDAFMYKLANEVTPARAYAFGKKESGNCVALFNIGNYNMKTNTYVTIVYDRKSGKDKSVKIVWEEVQ